MKKLIPLLFIFGCYGNEPSIDNGFVEKDNVTVRENNYPIVIRPSFQVQQLDVLQFSTDFWNKGIASRYIWALYVDNDYYWDVDVDVVLAETTQIDVYHEPNGEIFYCKISLARSITKHKELTIYMLQHEIGHCFGLEDDHYKHSIMNHDFFENPNVTSKDKNLIINEIF